MASRLFSVAPQAPLTLQSVVARAPIVDEPSRPPTAVLQASSTTSPASSGPVFAPRPTQVPPWATAVPTETSTSASRVNSGDFDGFVATPRSTTLSTAQNSITTPASSSSILPTSSTDITRPEQFTGLSKGAIAGISVAAAIIVTLLIMGAFFLGRRKAHKRSTTEERGMGEKAELHGEAIRREDVVKYNIEPQITELNSRAEAVELSAETRPTELSVRF